MTHVAVMFQKKSDLSHYITSNLSLNLSPFANLVWVHWALGEELCDLGDAGPAVLLVGQVHLSQHAVHGAGVGL